MASTMPKAVHRRVRRNALGKARMRVTHRPRMAVIAAAAAVVAGMAAMPAASTETSAAELALRMHLPVPIKAHTENKTPNISSPISAAAMAAPTRRCIV